MADFTLIKANPTQGEITSSLTGSTGDGAGLHFDGAAANVAFTPVGLGTKCSFEFVVKASSWTDSSFKYLVDFGSGGRFTIGTADTAGAQLAIYNGIDFITFGVSTLEDLKVHHLVVTIDGTAATLYDNGKQVGTATITTPNIDSCSLARLASKHNSTSGRFYGTYYRCRFYNKTLTSAEVQTAYERADVDFADQYGSQTSLVDAAASVFTSGTYSWSAYGSNTIANVGNALEITYVNHASGASNGLRDSSDLTTDLIVGKRYRLTVDAKYTGGSAGSKLQLALAGSNTDFATLTTSLVTYTYEFTADTAAGGGLRMSGMSAGNVVTIDNWYLREIGCVSDYDLAFANPTQSRMVADRSNAADGTASTSGVTQVQPVVQLNSTSARIGTTVATPADGELLVSSRIGVNADPSEPLHIDGDGEADILLTRTNEASSGTLGRIFFGANDGDKYLASVEGFQDGATDAGGLVFSTEATGGSRANRLTISSTGNVSVGGGTASSLVSGGDSPVLSIGATDASLLTNHKAGSLVFLTNDPSYTGTYADGITGEIVSVSESSTGAAYGLGFYTGTISSSNRAERLRISSGGDIELPTAGQTIKTDLSSGGTTRTGIIELYNGTTGALSLKTDNQATGGIEFWTEGQKRLDVQRDGVCTFSDGINLGDTTLSNYAEGTWTPVVEGGTSAGTYTSVFTNANYTRVGRMVTVNYNLAWNSHTGTGDLIITGLPFAVLANTAVIGAFQANSGLSWTAGYLPSAYGYSTKIQFRSSDDGGGSYHPMQIAATVNYLRGTLTYFI